jgi:hypothetical protein
MRRFLCIVLAGFVLAALAVWTLAAVRPVHPISAEGIRSVTPGLVRGDVEALFGGPPGDRRPQAERGWSVMSTLPDGKSPEIWYGGDGAALVLFDGDGRVLFANFIEAPSVLGNVRDLVRSALGG